VWTVAGTPPSRSDDRAGHRGQQSPLDIIGKRRGEDRRAARDRTETSPGGPTSPPGGPALLRGERPEARVVGSGTACSPRPHLLRRTWRRCAPAQMAWSAWNTSALPPGLSSPEAAAEVSEQPYTRRGQGTQPRLAGPVRLFRRKAPGNHCLQPLFVAHHAQQLVSAAHVSRHRYSKMIGYVMQNLSPVRLPVLTVLLIAFVGTFLLSCGGTSASPPPSPPSAALPGSASTEPSSGYASPFVAGRI
jgi:hypothetical protein